MAGMTLETAPSHKDHESRDRAKAFKGQAKSEFEKWAHRYDRSLLGHFLFRPTYVALMEEIAHWRKTHDGPFAVLDIGCGTGSFCSMLGTSQWPVEVVGMDFSPNMCDQGHQKIGNMGLNDRVRFVAGDSEHLPFADATFDFVVCANSFHHYPDQQAVVRDIHRILKPGGRFILADGFRDNAIGWVVFDVIIATVEKQVYHAPWSEVAQFFENAGFQHVGQQKINVLFPVLLTSGDV
ncbi:MAG: class I SAM-dependent methyltransferase [Planctomycetota bacterium]|jgi:ubiquinone/menaquinone biosynthesis C-methylase UbiE